MTRFTFACLKPVALFLSMIVLFLNCKVYDKTPATIEQAINKDHKKAKRIKIEMVDGEKIILDSVYYKDNELFGLLAKSKEKSTSSKASNVKEEVKIDKDKITQIRLQNRAKSITGTVFLTAGSVAAGWIIIFALIWQESSEDNGN
jgi:hypothetical protein